MNPDEDGPKRSLSARAVKVLVHHRTERGMSLEPHASRCVRAGEVHELVTTDHAETGAGARIDRVAFLGFAEFDHAGCSTAAISCGSVTATSAPFSGSTRATSRTTTTSWYTPKSR